MNVATLLSKYYNQEGMICITDQESDLYIGRFDIDSIEKECEWLPKAWVVGLKNNTTAISGSKKMAVALEVTVGNWDVRGEYDL